MSSIEERNDSRYFISGVDGVQHRFAEERAGQAFKPVQLVPTQRVTGHKAKHPERKRRHAGVIGSEHDFIAVFAMCSEQNMFFTEQPDRPAIGTARRRLHQMRIQSHRIRTAHDTFGAKIKAVLPFDLTGVPTIEQNHRIHGRIRTVTCRRMIKDLAERTNRVKAAPEKVSAFSEKRRSRARSFQSPFKRKALVPCGTN